MSTATKIMPLGASNTYGMYEDSTSPGGYRGPLQYMLQSQGVNYDFVGLDQDGAIGDAEHNGYSGKRIEWFTSSVNEAIHDRNGTYSHTVDTNGQPAVQYFIEQAGLVSTDVILLLAGTNNVIAGHSAEYMRDQMDKLLSLIVTSGQSPEVRLMKLQPVGGDWWEDYDPTRTNNQTIEIFNTYLEDLAAKYASSGVTLVDSKATTADLSSDGVHLSEAGYRKTAAAWYESLKADPDLAFQASRPQLASTSARQSDQWTKEFYGGKRNDKITGDENHNKLDGRQGGDTMTGLGGDDTYVVDNRGDGVVEQAGGGVDTVLTTLTTYTLGNHVENLTITGSSTSNATLTGNAIDNILRGGAANDIMNGGAGADVYWGGAGADTFVLRKGEAAGDCVNLEAGDVLRLEGFGRGAVLVENHSPTLGTTTDPAGDWCISYNGRVEVIQINGRTSMTEGVDYVFV